MPFYLKLSHLSCLLSFISDFMYSISHSCLVAIPTKSVEPFVCLPLVYSSGVLIKLKWPMQICFTKFNQIQMRNLKLGQRAHWALMPGSICLKTWKVVKTLFPVFIYKLVPTFESMDNLTLQLSPAIVNACNKPAKQQRISDSSGKLHHQMDIWWINYACVQNITFLSIFHHSKSFGCVANCKCCRRIL